MLCVLLEIEYINLFYYKTLNYNIDKIVFFQAVIFRSAKTTLKSFEILSIENVYTYVNQI